MGKLKVTQIRSAIDRGARQKGTVRALGLKRLGRPVLCDDKPEIRGMLSSIEHLVKVEEINE